MTQRERREFIQFAWGRSTLPKENVWNSHASQQEFFIRRYSTKAGENPDDYLISANACSFQISLPMYSSKETLEV